MTEMRAVIIKHDKTAVPFKTGIIPFQYGLDVLYFYVGRNQNLGQEKKNKKTNTKPNSEARAIASIP
jgi:hypothetical protein